MKWRRPCVMLLFAIGTQQLATQSTHVDPLTVASSDVVLSNPPVVKSRQTSSPFDNTNTPGVCLDEECRIVGQPDLYGFGTRLGIYDQLFTQGETWTALIRGASKRPKSTCPGSGLHLTFLLMFSSFSALLTWPTVSLDFRAMSLSPTQERMYRSGRSHCASSAHRLHRRLKHDPRQTRRLFHYHTSFLQSYMS